MLVEQVLHDYLRQRKVSFQMLNHPPCRTSAESASARAGAGAPDAVGAKALIVVTKTGFSMLVLPGMRRLDSKRTRSILGKFRFARPDEVREASGGLEIGTIPPFGKPVLTSIEQLIVDVRIAHSAEIGFNAACLTRSAVMPAYAYMDAAKPDYVEDISLPGEDHEDQDREASAETV